MRRRLLTAFVIVMCGVMCATAAAEPSGLAQGEQTAGRYAGRSLTDVLRDLQARGLKVVFSSELVWPQMRVLSEPKSAAPRTILDEVLEPHGLRAAPGPKGTWLVVRAAGRFRTAARAVPIYATATDRSGAPVTDLAAADFQIEDNGARQSVTVFENGIQPITIAILIDTSPSLFPVFSRAAAALEAFTSRLTHDDRACLGVFSHVVTLDPTLTANPETLLGRLAAPAPWPAGTAIWDAVEAGRGALEAQGGRRVVLIVSDGNDNASRVDPDGTRTKLLRDGVMVYAVLLRGRFGLDTSEIGALANATGGRAVELKSADNISAAMKRIADELHHQYVIGFSPETLDGKLHRLDVRVTRPGVTVRARRNYVAARTDPR
jgi:Ca-activated chloride channel family protein